ncbi:MAG: 50S ribosomal protein L4 [Actinomycetales bacterium]|nr:50S ribosomal protein L4 [Candidatus Phosphoribacter baldrii]
MGTTTALPADIFDVQVNVPLIHQVVAAQLAAARQGTHATKTRGLVSGGGKKPYRQKGTGRARQGSTRAPQFAGGGVVHGPQPRDYSQRTPKKMKAAALRGALSDRARNGRVHVLDAIVSGDTPSTSAAAAVLARLTDRTKFLVVLERGDQVGLKSVRNLDSVHVLAVDQLNTYDVLCADDVVFTAGALATFTASSSAPVAAAAPVAPAKAEKVEKAEKPAKAQKAATLVEAADAAPAPKATKAAKAAEVVAEASADAPAQLPAGAAAPLEDGSAPEGYSVKGNADSGLYHEPDGRWYDATVAEFWFKSGADAEAAGFKKAGSRAKAAAKDGEDAK